jgi:hypothetical protein
LFKKKNFAKYTKPFMNGILAGTFDVRRGEIEWYNFQTCGFFPGIEKW